MELRTSCSLVASLELLPVLQVRRVGSAPKPVMSSVGQIYEPSAEVLMEELMDVQVGGDPVGPVSQGLGHQCGNHGGEQQEEIQSPPFPPSPLGEELREKTHRRSSFSTAVRFLWFLRSMFYARVLGLGHLMSTGSGGFGLHQAHQEETLWKTWDTLEGPSLWTVHWRSWRRTLAPETSGGLC